MSLRSYRTEVAERARAIRKKQAEAPQPPPAPQVEEPQPERPGYERLIKRLQADIEKRGEKKE
jgi:hypothetical protein